MRDKSEDLDFGFYRILHPESGDLWELGRSGYITTYKAEHKHLGVLCILKVMNDGRSALKRAFLISVQSMALVDHPNVARVYDFGESNGSFFLRLDLLRRGEILSNM